MIGATQMNFGDGNRNITPLSTASLFSSSTSYAVDDYCFYDGTLYRCTTAHSGVWNASHFVAVTIADELADVKSDLSEIISGGGGVTDALKLALLQIAQKVAYIDDGGQDYYQDLYDALYGSAPVVDLESISAVYTQSGTVYDTASLDDLKSDLVVTATYSDSTTETVTTYTLSGTLTEGTSTITVSYGGKTTTFTVTVTHWQAEEVLWIDGYSDSNSTQAKAQYAPFYLTSQHYTFDYTKSITAIELKVYTAGTIAIGHQDESTVIGKGSSTARGAFTVDETITLTQTGKQKITLTTPITLSSGECLGIMNVGNTAVFLYGTNGTNKGFYYCGASNVTANNNNSLGINVYVA